MIARISGRLIQKKPSQTVVDVNGVGYGLSITLATFYALPDVGAQVTLHIHTIVREDAITLYGFLSPGEREVFERLIDLSLELGLPLNVHSRSAGREVIGLLLARGARRVQMHAFDGRATTALPAVEAGFYFSVPPSVVHSQQKRKLVRALPLDRLLLETDSPVLGPVPGARNEPANVLAAAGEIASIKGLATEEVLIAAYRNTRALYGEALG